jgi:glycosyltransferase involved in cell wall biosynthesis
MDLIHLGADAPRPPSPGPEETVRETWQRGPVVVSILCSVFNHAPFLKDTFDGFLSQVTEFPFEILVRDDASTDDSRQIIRDYSQRYPGIVRPILEPVNRYPFLRSRVVLGALARGRYLAYCDGDDYWLDPSKLQQQVSSLERSPELVLSHHQAVIAENGLVTSLAKLPQALCRGYSGTELTRGKWLITLSMVYRNVFVPVHEQASRFKNYDAYFISELGRHGGAVFEDHLLPGVYRRHPANTWSALDQDQRDAGHVVSYFYIARHYRDRGELEMAQHWQTKAVRQITSSLDLNSGIGPSQPVRPPLLSSSVRRVKSLWQALGRVAGRARRSLGIFRKQPEGGFEANE